MFPKNSKCKFVGVHPKAGGDISIFLVRNIRQSDGQCSRLSFSCVSNHLRCGCKMKLDWIVSFSPSIFVVMM